MDIFNTKQVKYHEIKFWIYFNTNQKKEIIPTLMKERMHFNTRILKHYWVSLDEAYSSQDLYNIQDPGGQPPSSALISLNQMGAGGHQIATVKRRKKSTAAPDKKKMYEEVRMRYTGFI